VKCGENENILSELLKKWMATVRCSAGERPAGIVLSGDASTGEKRWKYDPVLVDLSRKGEAKQLEPTVGGKVGSQRSDVLGERDWEQLSSVCQMRVRLEERRQSSDEKTSEEARYVWMWARMEGDLRWPYSEFELGLGYWSSFSRVAEADKMERSDYLEYFSECKLGTERFDVLSKYSESATGTELQWGKPIVWIYSTVMFV
jgi:hypothetical protein